MLQDKMYVYIMLTCLGNAVKFLNFRTPKKLCSNLPKIKTLTPNLREFHQKGANELANSEDPDQTAPVGAV